jgi:hypothetical protein
MGSALAMALLAAPLHALAQDADDSSPEGVATSGAPEAMSPPPDDSTGGPLPRPLGECGGAELQVLALEAPFGEPLGADLASGMAEVEYRLPEGAVNAFISFNVPDAAGLSLKGSDILERNPEASSIDPDASYSSGTMTATITDPSIAERTTASADLVGASEAVYVEKWGFSGVDLADFMDPPYAHGDQLEIFLAFEFDGSIYSWSSKSSTNDCFVR